MVRAKCTVRVKTVVSVILHTAWPSTIVVEQEEQEGQDADDEAEAEEPQKKKEKKKKKLRRRTIAKPDASVEWQAERAMLAAREAQVIYDGMGWTLRVGSVRLCDV